MSASKTERLLNLLIALLERQRGYSKEELRSLIQPYREAATEEAFNRIFERDKEDLREMGVPVETFSEEAFFDADHAVKRYRIDRKAYRLPELAFTPEETAVLSLASRIWQQASLGSAAARAVRRLDVHGALSDGDSPIGIEPRLRTAEPAFDELLKALTGRYPVSFEYRAANNADTTTRHVEPWGLGNRFGHWYLSGFDTDRGGQRTFRLSRITSGIKKLSGDVSVPEEFTMRAALDALDPEREQGTARLLLRHGRAQSLRTSAVPASPKASVPEGWDEVQCPYSDVEILAEEVASHGATAVALEPAELVAAVVRRFQGALDAAARTPPSYTLPAAAASAGHKKTSSLDHLPRLLDLVSYISANPGAELGATAEKFGVSRAQLIKDLNLLFVCGTPGYGPDQLIEVHWDNDSIFIENAEEISSTVRMSLDEALSLVVGLQALETVPGVGERPALRSALSKLLDATGGEHGLHRSLAADFDARTTTAEVQALQDAVAAGETLRIEYLVSSRDEMTVREIDPLQVFAVNGHWYTEAWCHDKQAVRQFRADKIRGLERTGRTFQPPGGRSSEFPQSLFTPRETDQLAVLHLSPRLADLADQYNAERRCTLPDGSLIAELRLGTTAIIPQLVARHGGEVTVVEPPELAVTTREWLTAALAAYSEISKAGGLDS
ncbi:transcriptional regulator-like protein [Arthrobacter crystallopoietes BAB-32]|uniref:Transcriptional regulator-like protein n=1 Tax=Arthrobacter crystallopoietes BAB-32 TaxID=1246476 RepID=N1V2M6_9MICC|nr:WYL domain-containing protein [Arthrobacter crystallopoietes]EMY35605.1 transcriptional regulator-like protein [Arthrobacter crystallopoietes BAB-32]